MTAGDSSASNFRVLLAFLAAPLAWTAHLLLSYLVVAVGCAQEWQLTRLVLVLITIVAGAAAVWPAWRILRVMPRVRVFEWLAAAERVDATSRFLVALGAITSGLFLLAIILGGIGPLLVPLCDTSH